MYQIGEFVESHLVAGIPVIWIFKKQSKHYCYWPIRNLTKKIEKRTPPPLIQDSKSWNIFQIKLLLGGMMFHSLHSVEEKVDRIVEALTASENDSSGNMSTRTETNDEDGAVGGIVENQILTMTIDDRLAVANNRNESIVALDGSAKVNDPIFAIGEPVKAKIRNEPTITHPIPMDFGPVVVNRNVPIVVNPIFEIRKPVEVGRRSESSGKHNQLAAANEPMFAIGESVVTKSCNEPIITHPIPVIFEPVVANRNGPIVANPIFEIREPVEVVNGSESSDKDNEPAAANDPFAIFEPDVVFNPNVLIAADEPIGAIGANDCSRS